MGESLTIHMIGNAHLDPVWLWTKDAGVDEAINTCRTACDLLDEYPDFIVTRGEAWVHEQVRLIDPELFERIKVHAATGRWAIVNGWWIQPDCNLPSAASFRKQGELGRQWFKEYLNVDVTVGYNVDSFGHTAMLPSFLKQTGFDSYVFMRPGPGEMELPSNLFNWQAPDGTVIPTFRITPVYNPDTPGSIEYHLPETIKDAPEGIGHTMFWYGVGDHGGGPTREQIEWIEAHKNYSDDIELIFSSPQKYFTAVKNTINELPTVTEELQYHAIGCYSAVQSIKIANRDAQFACEQAERQLDQLPESIRNQAAHRLQRSWEQVLFNQFHDILAGSSIEKAYDEAAAELGLACAEARDILTISSRLKAYTLEPNDFQRMVICNPGNETYSGLVSLEPWINYPLRDKPVAFFHTDGTEIPYQKTEARAAVKGMHAYLIPASIEPDEMQVIEMRHIEPAVIDSAMHADSEGFHNGGLNIKTGDPGISAIQYNDKDVLGAAGIRIEVYEDPTDTWSHGISGYEGLCCGTFNGEGDWVIRENGPVRSRLTRTMTWENSRAECSLICEQGTDTIRLAIRLNWSGQNKVVKMIVPPAFNISKRLDRVPGAYIERPCNGQEYPIEHIVSLQGDDSCLSIISKDIFSADVRTDGSLRMTLLRCPPYAHHEPLELETGHGFPFTDQGEHVYDFAFIPSTEWSQAEADQELYRQHQPLIISEVTKGMPSRV